MPRAWVAFLLVVVCKRRDSVLVVGVNLNLLLLDPSGAVDSLKWQRLFVMRGYF